MHCRFFLLLVVLATAVTACQQQPPTVIVKIVTATPYGENIAAASDAILSAAATEDPTRVLPTQTPAPTPTPDLFPTPVAGQLQVAEQPFEHGRMFWIQPRGEIWVMIETGDGKGTWQIFQDTFADGQPESDSDIVPPEEGLYQPERGFGKLWREHEDVRAALGWAVTPDEFGYVSRYEYHVLPTVNEAGEVVPSPAGYHILFSLYEQPFRFNESDNTWQEGRGDDDESDENSASNADG